MFLRNYFLQKSKTTYYKSLDCCEINIFVWEGRRGLELIKLTMKQFVLYCIVLKSDFGYAICRIPHSLKKGGGYYD
jgi:hypothetical protein